MTHTQPTSSSRNAVTVPTSSSRMLASEGRVGTKSGVVARGRGTLASITDVETALLTLTPAFLGALRGVAPKKPRSKVGYVIALAIIAVIGVLAADTSTREFGITKGRAIAAHLHRAPAAQPVEAPGAVPVNAPVVTTAAQAASVPSAATVSLPEEQVAAPVVNVAPAKRGTKTGPAVQSKKPQPRSAVRPSMKGRTATLATKPSTREL